MTYYFWYINWYYINVFLIETYSYSLNSLILILILNFTVTFVLSENVRWHRLASASRGNERATRTCCLCRSFFRSMYDLSVVRRMRSTSSNASKVGASLESRILASSSFSKISSARLAVAISFFWRSSIRMPHERCHCTMWAIRCASTYNGVTLVCSKYLLSSVHIWPSFSRRYMSMQHSVIWRKVRKLIDYINKKSLYSAESNERLVFWTYLILEICILFYIFINLFIKPLFVSHDLSLAICRVESCNAAWRICICHRLSRWFSKYWRSSIALNRSCRL